MPGTSKLALYNEALTLCRETKLSGLTEDREARHLLDQVYDGGGIRRVLEAGQWHFAMRTVQVDSDPDLDPEFGFQYAFSKPTDWVLTSALCSDAYFRAPMSAAQYVDESGYWYADVDPIYVRYVSDDEDYGGDLGTWPQSFVDYAVAHFASKVVFKLTSSEALLETVVALERQRLKFALSRNRMASGSGVPAQGGWTTTRRGGGRDRDNGNTGSLTG